MAATSQQDEDDIITGINVTPLVDIFMVLLIIFIVTASFLVKSVVPIDLPTAASGEAAAQGLLTIALTKEGDLFINGKPDRLESLKERVAEAAQARGGDIKSVEAFVSADAGAPYGQFARIVDRLRLEGVGNVALDTRPEEGTP